MRFIFPLILLVMLNGGHIAASHACYTVRGKPYCLELRIENGIRGVAVPNGPTMPLTNEIAVRFHDGTSLGEQQKILSRFHLSPSHPYPDWTVYVMTRVAPHQDPFAIAHELSRHPAVKWTQPVWLERPRINAITPNDTYFADQWHHPMVRTNEAWDITTGDPAIVIAVVDSGVDTQHPDLWTHLLIGKSFVPSEPYVDPNMKGTLLDPNPFMMAHGTAVSGVACATGNNGIGVAGVCWHCGLLPVKYIGYEVGDVPVNRKLDALKWAVDNGAWVINNSWSAAPDTDSSDQCITVAPDNFMAEAISYGLQYGRNGRGTVMVWAAGNSHCDTALNATLATDEIVVVSALRKDGSITDYSNWGSAIDIAAPSGGDNSDVVALATTDATAPNKGFNPVYANNGYPDLPDQSYTKYFNGTSAASPVVAGAIGLLFSVVPSLTAAEAISCLKLSAATPSASCPYGTPDFCYGAGILDVQKLLENALAGICSGSPECSSKEECDPGEDCVDGSCVPAPETDDAPAYDDEYSPDDDPSTIPDEWQTDTGDTAVIVDETQEPDQGSETLDNLSSVDVDQSFVEENPENGCGCSLVF